MFRRILSLLLACLLFSLSFVLTSCTQEPPTDPADGTQDPADTDLNTPPEEDKPEPKKTLKVLTLGNSFSEDAHRYLIDIMKEQGMEDVVLGNLVKSACDLQTHLSQATSDKGIYIYYKFDLTEGKTTQVKYTVSKALEDEDWDIIVLQQVSGKSGMPATYASLQNLVNYIKPRVSEDCQFAWHMTWAYQNGSGHSDFPKYSNNQMTMYNAITSAVQQQIVDNETFDYIIPSGTAIQNARTSYFRDTLTRDGYHLSEMGRCIIGYTWYKTLTGNELTEIGLVPDPQFLTLTDSDRAVVLESVLNAVETPFAVTNSENTSR